MRTVPLLLLAAGVFLGVASYLTGELARNTTPLTAILVVYFVGAIFAVSVRGTGISKPSTKPSRSYKRDLSFSLVGIPGVLGLFILGLTGAKT